MARSPAQLIGLRHVDAYSVARHHPVGNSPLTRTLDGETYNGLSLIIHLGPYDFLPVPGLLLYRQRHGNWFQRIVEFVARDGDDLIHHLHASKDFAEDGVGAVQSAAVIDADIEL